MGVYFLNKKEKIAVLLPVTNYAGKPRRTLALLAGKTLFGRLSGSPITRKLALVASDGFSGISAVGDSIARRGRERVIRSKYPGFAQKETDLGKWAWRISSQEFGGRIHCLLHGKKEGGHQLVTPCLPARRVSVA